jgi:hypothetical protein
MTEKMFGVHNYAVVMQGLDKKEEHPLKLNEQVKERLRGFLEAHDPGESGSTNEYKVKYEKEARYFIFVDGQIETGFSRSSVASAWFTAELSDKYHFPIQYFCPNSLPDLQAQFKECTENPKKREIAKTIFHIKVLVFFFISFHYTTFGIHYFLFIGVQAQPEVDQATKGRKGEVEEGRGEGGGGGLGGGRGRGGG